MDYYSKLRKAGYVGNTLGQKNDYGDGGIFDGLFLAPNWNCVIV